MLLAAAFFDFLTVPLAFVFAYVIQRSCIPYKGVWRNLAMIPILAPLLLAAISFIYLVGNEEAFKFMLPFQALMDPAYDFKTIYARTRERGNILNPGKLTRVGTLRADCPGAIDANEMRNVAGLPYTLRSAPDRVEDGMQKAKQGGSCRPVLYVAYLQPGPRTSLRLTCACVPRLLRPATPDRAMKA